MPPKRKLANTNVENSTNSSPPKKAKALVENVEKRTLRTKKPLVEAAVAVVEKKVTKAKKVDKVAKVETKENGADEAKEKKGRGRKPKQQENGSEEAKTQTNPKKVAPKKQVGAKTEKVLKEKKVPAKKITKTANKVEAKPKKAGRKPKIVVTESDQDEEALEMDTEEEIETKPEKIVKEKKVPAKKVTKTVAKAKKAPGRKPKPKVVENAPETNGELSAIEEKPDQEDEASEIDTEEEMKPKKAAPKKKKEKIVKSKSTGSGPEKNGESSEVVEKQDQQEKALEMDTEVEVKPKKARKEKEKPVKVESEPEQDEEAEKPTKSRAGKAKTTAKPKDEALLNNTTTDWSKIDFTCSKLNNEGNQPNLKITSWNVNGLRSLMAKDGLEILKHDQPDIFCIQETKCSDKKIPEELQNITDYKMYWCGSEKEGYAGVGLFSKKEPLTIQYGIGLEEFDDQGRCITAEYEKFYVVCVYVPNAGRGLVTLPHRLNWNEEFKKFIKNLDEKKPVIICGDMNVAHTEIDLKNPSTNKKNAGFTLEERDGMTDFLNNGFIDTFRYLYPDKKDVYTFWTFMKQAREKNVGWRISNPSKP